MTVVWRLIPLKHPTLARDVFGPFTAIKNAAPFVLGDTNIFLPHSGKFSVQLSDLVPRDEFGPSLSDAKFGNQFFSDITQ